MGHHRCVCGHDFCLTEGGGATIRMPKDEATFKSWCIAIFGEETLPKPLRDPRISLVHFPPGSLTADDSVGAVGGANVGVKVKDGALPSQTNADMERDSKGALARSLRAQALVERHERALLAKEKVEQGLKAEISNLRLRIASLEMQNTDGHDGGGGLDSAPRQANARNGIDHSILVEKSPEACRSLVGLSSHESLATLYGFLDAEGAAEHMVFFDQRDGGGLTSKGEKVQSRQKVFRGLNGLCFTLFVMRTAMPIATASALFGVHETTGGRAFTTWLNFLDRSFRPLVRLPSLGEVQNLAPKNFKDKGYGNCVIVLDATELEIPRTWQTDMNWACFSTYKGRQTAKVLVGITPAGAICYIGPAYPGRITDADLVKASGLLQAMKEAGLSGHGLLVMSDKGFNAISPLLVKEDLLYVAPPYKRQRESQFTGADMEVQWEVANLRIHVERAIGGMKNWRILQHKFDHKRLDQLEMCFHVVAALVNIIHRPFRSDR